MGHLWLRKARAPTQNTLPHVIKKVPPWHSYIHTKTGQRPYGISAVLR